MIKDPLHVEETPYELLGLDPNTPKNKVQPALALFMRNTKDKRRIPKAQAAVKILKNSAERIEVDIFHYSAEISKDDIVDNEIDLSAVVSEFLIIPELSDAELYSDLQRDDLSGDFSDIKFNKIKLGELKRHDDIESYKMEINFNI